MNINTRITLIIIAILVVLGYFTFSSFKKESIEENTKVTQTQEDVKPITTPAPDLSKASLKIESQPTKKPMKPQTIKTTSGLSYEITKEGTGATAEKEKVVSVHYTGTLLDGTVFDSSVPRGQAFEFILGAGQVIKGWDEGVAGMKIGEKRTLHIPYQLAYGENGHGPIPAKADLNFDVELLAVK
jgi:peptidylprolyl isomerase